MAWIWSSFSLLPFVGVWSHFVRCGLWSRNLNICDFMANKIVSSCSIISSWTWRSIWWATVFNRVCFIPLKFTFWFLIHCNVSTTFAKCEIISDVISRCLILLFSFSQLLSIFWISQKLVGLSFLSTWTSKLLIFDPLCYISLGLLIEIRMLQVLVWNCFSMLIWTSKLTCLLSRMNLFRFFFLFIDNFFILNWFWNTVEIVFAGRSINFSIIILT